MVLFRGSASVRDSGFFFNIEASLHSPIGPFRTAKAIIQAALQYIASHSITCPSHEREYVDLTLEDMQLNRSIRLTEHFTQLEKDAKMKRPHFDWTAYKPH